MKDLTLPAAALGLALSGSMALPAARAAVAPEPPGSGSQQSDIGAVTGLALGAAAAGPVGALSQARARVDELAEQLGRTDQLGLDVSFRTDDDSVAAASMSPLLKLGALAASLPQAQLSVAGFTDPRGSDLYNQDLSLRRAQNVAAVLQSAGVPPERIRVEAHGKAAAGSADGDLDSYALERRVLVRLQLPASAEFARRD